MTVSYQDIPEYLFPYLLEWGGYAPPRPWEWDGVAAAEHASELGLLVSMSGVGQPLLSDIGKAAAQRYFDARSELAPTSDPTTSEATPTGIDGVIAERSARYGEFVEHARIAQSIKREMQDSPKWEMLRDDQKEALEMIAHKIGRILNGDPNYADSWTDIIGYARLVEKRLLP
jgi:hypothetical protein